MAGKLNQDSLYIVGWLHNEGASVRCGSIYFLLVIIILFCGRCCKVEQRDGASGTKAVLIKDIDLIRISVDYYSLA